jgi:hypothetical protein
MEKTMNCPTGQQVVNLQVAEGLSVAVVQDSAHEFLMTTQAVALGYGITPNTIKSTKFYHKDELQQGVHYRRRCIASVYY